MRTITTEQARAVIDVAVRKSNEIGVPMSIAILDAGRDLLAFLRMDNALLGSIEIAQAKAYTSRTVNMKTAELGPLVQPGGPIYGLEVSHGRPLIVFGGGAPVRRGGVVVGAVGISGGSPDEDVMVADAVTGFLEAM